MISIHNLHFDYGNVAYKVFQDFSLELPDGKIVGLLGRNGTGKSSLLYLISGLLRPTQGEVFVDGSRSQERAPELLQDLMIVPEEIELPAVSFQQYLDCHRVFYPNFSEEVLHQVLRDFDLPTEIHLKALSMGQKKKVYMAFALATNTKYLLMDEPTNGLDIPSKMQFRRVIASQMNEQRTIIVSTHQVHDVEQLIDHVVLIEGSHLLVDESTARLTQLLRFEQRPYGASVDDALYVEPSISGASVITSAVGKPETPLNLEVFFNAVVQYPDLLQKAAAMQQNYAPNIQ